MRGVTFDAHHSYWAWGLMLKKAPEISPPEPKTHDVDIPGMHGKLDLMKALTGKVQYKNRTITMEFASMAGREEWSAIYAAILAALHGQTKEITLDDDPLYHYTGRVTVGTPKWENETVTVKMTADVGPYKKSVEGTVML